MGLFEAIAGVFGIGAVTGRARENPGSSYGNVDESIAMSTGTLRVEAEGGNVVVQGWDRDEIRVVAGGHDAGLRPAYARTGDVVTLRGLARDGHIETDDVDYVISVPAGVEVHVRSESGDVVGRGTVAPFRVESESGNVAVKDLRGPLRVSTECGDVAVAGLAGDVRVESESGNVALRASRAPNACVTVRTGSGDIVAAAIGGTTLLESESGNITAASAALRAEDTFTVRTECGNVVLSVPAGMPLTLDVATEGGRFVTDLDIATERQNDDGVHVSQRLNGGGARVSIASESGNIVLRAG